MAQAATSPLMIDTRMQRRRDEIMCDAPHSSLRIGDDCADFQAHATAGGRKSLARSPRVECCRPSTAQSRYYPTSNTWVDGREGSTRARLPIARMVEMRQSIRCPKGAQMFLLAIVGVAVLIPQSIWARATQLRRVVLRDALLARRADRLDQSQ